MTAVEVGAFVDGPEISGPANLPATGTATYNGYAGGLAVTRTGNDAWLARNGIPSGVYELFEYPGDFRAVADFGMGMIEASISNIAGYGWQEFPNGTLLEGEGATPGRCTSARRRSMQTAPGPGPRSASPIRVWLLARTAAGS